MGCAPSSSPVSKVAAPAPSEPEKETEKEKEKEMEKVQEKEKEKVKDKEKEKDKAKSMGAPQNPAGATNGTVKDDSLTKLAATVGDKERLVMNRYTMSMDEQAITGEGTSSICRKGQNASTGDAVAIKVYKESAMKQGDVTIQKFKRQVEVLEELQEPFKPVADKVLWHASLENMNPASLFMLLVDYSKDKNGEPGADPTDDTYYVITELGQYSLKDYLSLKREENRPLPAARIKNMSRSILLVVAGLHAKGLVHIDLKPENLMIFNGYLKLIDVDGCVKIGTDVRIQDASISFSPCYCAPEWASFIVNESHSQITVEPALDVWSIGMTLAELVALNVVMKPAYGSFLQSARNHRKAGFLFMDYLKSIQAVPLPKEVKDFNPEFFDLMTSWLLVPDCKKRKSCAQALDHPFIHSSTKSSGRQSEAVNKEDGDKVTHEGKRPQPKPNSGPIHQGRVWKLLDGGNHQDRAGWVEHDMWLAAAGSLCYFNAKEKKKYVLLDVHLVTSAKIHLASKEGARGPMFDLKYKDDENHPQVLTLAADTIEIALEWAKKLKSVARMDLPSMRLGEDITELREFVVKVKNRRQSLIDEDASDGALFKETLWKLKADGDRMQEKDWYERQMWISKNGNLCYRSKKEGRDLVYYPAEDLGKASYKLISAKDSCKPFTFQVVLPEVDGIEYAPGDFAAESEELRTKWMEAFQSGPVGN